jgi:hypothetical protein
VVKELPQLQFSQFTEAPVSFQSQGYRCWKEAQGKQHRPEVPLRGRRELLSRDQVCEGQNLLVSQPLWCRDGTVTHFILCQGHPMTCYSAVCAHGFDFEVCLLVEEHS